MAVVKYGTIVTEVRGKVGSVVFQRCGKSLSIRSQVSKNYSKFASNYSNRFDFASLALTWNSLSAAQKLSFKTQAPSFPTKDKFGNPIVLSGYNLFIMVNRTLLLGGRPLLTTAQPYYVSAPALVQFNNAIIASKSWQIIYTSLNPANHFTMVYVVAPLPNNSTQGNANMVFVGAYNPGVTGGIAIGADLWDVLKVLPKILDYIKVIVRCVNTVNGGYTQQEYGYVFFT